MAPVLFAALSGCWSHVRIPVGGEVYLLINPVGNRVQVLLRYQERTTRRGTDAEACPRGSWRSRLATKHRFINQLQADWKGFQPRRASNDAALSAMNEGGINVGR